MTRRTETALTGNFHFDPEALIIAGQKVPVDSGGYIPLMIFDRKFSIIQPALFSLGEGAVRMSLQKPFGFMRPKEWGSGSLVKSQKTRDVILAPVPRKAGKWLATLETDKPLTPTDLDLFNHGLNFYAAHASKHLR